MTGTDLSLMLKMTSCALWNPKNFPDTSFELLKNLQKSYGKCYKLNESGMTFVKRHRKMVAKGKFPKNSQNHIKSRICIDENSEFVWLKILNLYL